MRSSASKVLVGLTVAALLAAVSGEAIADFIITNNCPLAGYQGDTVTLVLSISDPDPGSSTFEAIDFVAVYADPPLTPVDVRLGSIWPGISLLDWTEVNGTLDVGALSLDPTSEPGPLFEVDLAIAPTATPGDYLLKFSEFKIDEVPILGVPDCVIHVNQIPEPSTLLALLSMGVLALGGSAWRRRKSRRAGVQGR